MNSESGPKGRKSGTNPADKSIDRNIEKGLEQSSGKNSTKKSEQAVAATAEAADELQPELAAGAAIAGLSRAEIVGKFKINPKDCGSPEVQVALITSRLQQLSKHFDKHVADRHSKRGMLQLISKRKGLLQYLNRESPQRYRSLIAELGLRK